jgi:AraC-like DNA-binding protein
MSVTPASSTPIRVSSSPLAPGDIVRGCEGFMKLNMQLDFVDRSPTKRQCKVVARSFGPVGVGRVLGGASSFIRAQPHLADGRDLISVVISGGGRFQVDSVRGAGRYAGGGAAILESRDTSVLNSFDDTSAWTICMERAPLEPLLVGMHGALQRCIQGGNPALCLLAGYLETLFSFEQDCDLALTSTHISDLALSALGVRGETQEVVRERSVRAVRLQTALDRLASDAVEPGLDPATFATRMGLSVRYLHRLLEPTGRSFAEHLLANRLERATGMLRDPALADLRIGEIAARAGFADISHFNRSFRRAFGDTPFGMRARAAKRTSH